MTTIYRNYRIAKLGDQYVAQSGNDEVLLISKDRRRLTIAIDDLWTSLELGVEPNWFSGNSAIDLDTFGPESAASETDPPARRLDRKISCPAFIFSALVVSAPLSYFMAIEKVPTRIDVMLTIGICAVAVAFGQKFALLACMISAVVFNFFAVEPLLEFQFPTIDEALFSLMNLAMTWGIPKLFKLRDYLDSRGTDQTRDT